MLKKKKPLPKKKKRILGKILVHLSFYNWAWPFPLNGKTIPSLWASEQHFGVDLVVRPPCDVQILRRMTVVMSANSFMFSYVCSNKKIVYAVGKTNWYLLSRNLVKKVFQLVSSVTISMSVESHGLVHNSCIEKCFFFFWYRKLRSLAHLLNWKITFDISLNKSRVI